MPHLCARAAADPALSEGRLVGGSGMVRQKQKTTIHPQ